jgi:hypothetical protein
MKHLIEIISRGMMYVPSFVKIDGVQTILMIRLRNLKGCNVGVINGGGL